MRLSQPPPRSVFGPTEPYVPPPSTPAPASTSSVSTTPPALTTATAAATAAAGGSFVRASTDPRDLQSALLVGPDGAQGVRAHGKMPLCSQDWPIAVRFGATTVGTLAPFREENGVALHDVSGAANNGKLTVLVDDGGTSGVYNKLRVIGADGAARELALTSAHKDLEDVTAYPDGSFLLTASLSGDDADAHATTRVVLDPGGTSIVKEQTVRLREPLFAALEARFGARFVERVKQTPAKAGGLNIEGIAALPTSSLSPSSHGFVYGLRSPLFAPGASGGGAPNDEPPLDRGKALLAVVNEPFSAAPQIEIVEVDLGGHGVRGMEYVPELKGFVIIGGPVEKGDGYSLWLWRKSDGEQRASPLHIEGFDGLRRPESVLQVADGNRNSLVIMSEQSGPACEGAPYNFIQVELTRSLAAPGDDPRSIVALP